MSRPSRGMPSITRQARYGGWPSLSCRRAVALPRACPRPKSSPTVYPPTSEIGSAEMRLARIISTPSLLKSRSLAEVEKAWCSLSGTRSTDVTWVRLLLPEGLKLGNIELTHISGHFACKRVPVGDDHAWLEKGGSASKAKYHAAYPITNPAMQSLSKLNCWPSSRTRTSCPTATCGSRTCGSTALAPR